MGNINLCANGTYVFDPYIVHIFNLKETRSGGWTYEIIMQGSEIGGRKKGGKREWGRTLLMKSN